MNTHHLNRCTVLGGMSVLALAPLAGIANAASLPAITAYRNPGCGCCEKWAEHLRAAGFEVNMQDDPELSARRTAAGVPADIAGCHTAYMGEYIIEGHVPANDILKLLDLKFTALGLAVRGMPVGSPGMEMGDEKEPYDVLLMQRDGSFGVFTHYA